MPLVWVSRWRTVTRSDRSSTPSRTPGSTSATVASYESRPSSTSWATIVAVQVLVIEPIWNTLSGVTSTPVRVLSTPVRVHGLAAVGPHAEHRSGDPRRAGRLREQCGEVGHPETASAAGSGEGTGA